MSHYPVCLFLLLRSFCFSSMHPAPMGSPLSRGINPTTLIASLFAVLNSTLRALKKIKVFTHRKIYPFLKCTIQQFLIYSHSQQPLSNYRTLMSVLRSIFSLRVLLKWKDQPRWVSTTLWLFLHLTGLFIRKFATAAFVTGDIPTLCPHRAPIFPVPVVLVGLQLLFSGYLAWGAAREVVKGNMTQEQSDGSPIPAVL